MHTKRWITLGPGIAFLAVFFLIPLSIMLIYSFLEQDVYGGVNFSPTLSNYLELGNPDYLSIMWRSLRLGFLTTLICLVMGYPLAWIVSRMPVRQQVVWIFFLSIPAWMNLLVKNYAWIVILRKEGLLNQFLLGLGLISEPVEFLFHESAIVTGLVHSFLPFMVLPLYTALERLERSQLEAARDLGASGFRVFVRVILPLSQAGLWAGVLLVFIPAFGAYLTPDLLGGADAMMAGSLIQNQFLLARNWPSGSALAAVIVVLISLCLVIFRKVGGSDEMRIGG